MTTLQLDFRTDIRCWGDASIHSKPSLGVFGEEIRGIRARRWCPGRVVFLLYFSSLIFNEQSQGMLSIWDVLQCKICFPPNVSGLDLN